MVNTKDQSNAIVYCVCFVVCWHCQYEDQSMQCIQLNAMFVDTVDTGVVAFTQHCIQSNEVWKLYSTLTPAKRESYLKSLPSCGFSCLPVWGGSFVKRSLSCIDSIDIYSIDGIIEKSSVSAFQNFFRIENRLNIEKVMGRNVWMCFVSTVST